MFPGSTSTWGYLIQMPASSRSMRCGPGPRYWRHSGEFPVLARGRDTGFSSWRTIHYRRCVVQGIQPDFRDARDYDNHPAILLRTEALLDQDHIGWATRLCSHYPSVEVRIPDIQMSSEESVLLALIVRALVNTSLAAPSAGNPVCAEILDIALRQGAKQVLQRNHIDPANGNSVSSKAMPGRLIRNIQDSFDAFGDTNFLHQGLAKWARTGNEAQRQRGSHVQSCVQPVIRDAAGGFPT